MVNYICRDWLVLQSITTISGDQTDIFVPELLEIKQDTEYRNDVQDEIRSNFFLACYGYGGSAISLGFKIPILLTASDAS